MDSQKIKSLVELMSSSDLSELTYQEGDVSLTLHRAKGAALISSSPILPFDTSSESTEVSMSALRKPQIECALSSHIDSATKVQSPLYGVVYLSPSEEESAFVSVGDSVIEGQTLCLLEAMKMFHPIQAETPGIIREIHVESGDEVESGQVLFLIDEGR